MDGKTYALSGAQPSAFEHPGGGASDGACVRSGTLQKMIDIFPPVGMIVLKNTGFPGGRLCVLSCAGSGKREDDRRKKEYNVRLAKLMAAIAFPCIAIWAIAVYCLIIF